MKLVHLIMILSVLFLLGGTILYEMDIPSPGSTGMNSQSDFDAMKQTDSRYSENVDVSTHDGVLERRVAIKRVNDTNRAVYGGAACYDMGLNKRVIVGVLAVNDTASIRSCTTGTIVTGTDISSLTLGDTVNFWSRVVVDTLAVDSFIGAASQYFKSRVGHDLGILRVSDSFGNLIKTNIPNDVGTRKVQYCSKSAYHDFTKFGDLLIHADGSGLPSVFSMKNYDDSASPDTMMYRSRFIDLSPERPGQPRVRAIDLNTTTKLNGIYEYCYAFVDPSQGIGFGSGLSQLLILDTSFHSIIIEARNKNVLIDGFSPYTYVFSDRLWSNRTKRAVYVHLFRRDISSLIGRMDSDTSTTSESQWKKVTTFKMPMYDSPLIIDSGQSSGSLANYHVYDNRVFSLTLWIETDTGRPYPSPPMFSPGAPISDRFNTADPIDTSSISFEFPDSIMTNGSIKYSWYDPQTGLESGLSPNNCFRDTVRPQVMIVGMKASIPTWNIFDTAHIYICSTMFAGIKYGISISPPETWETWNELMDSFVLAINAKVGLKDSIMAFDDLTGIRLESKHNRVKSTIPFTCKVSSKLDTVSVPQDASCPYFLLDSVAGGYKPLVTSLPYLHRSTTPTNWIRLYRSVKKSSLAGAGDSNVNYCVAQIPVDASLHNWEGATVLLGVFPDSMLANGPINTSLLDQTYSAIGSNSTILGNAGTPYTMDNETYNYSGEEVIRPPVVNPLVIPFKDMEYSNGRLWGIGDPLYPQRLYYSGFDDAKQMADINDWSVNYYFSMDENENDELVGIEKAESGVEDILYVFKHNRIYVVTGTDPQSDMTIQSLTAEYGALNRFCIFKKNNSIFFMDKRHRIYGLANGQAAWISQPIQDYVDSVFAPHDSYIRVYALDNKINFIQTYPQDYRAVSFNELTGTWSVEKYYANVVPAGSFQYDTNRATIGFGNQSWWVFENNTGAAYFWRECTGKYDSVGGVTIYRFPVKYQTSFVGDGKNLWQIQYVQLTATVDSAQYLVAKVKDQDGVVRSADSVLVTPDAWRNYTIGLPNYQGMWLSVEISGAISKLDDVKLTMRKVGSAPLR